ncbi:hypothetical protein ACROYT_G016755 [Oculina patagonica]
MSSLQTLQRPSFTTNTRKVQWKKSLVVIEIVPSCAIREKFQVHLSLTEDTASVDKVQKMLEQQLGFKDRLDGKVENTGKGPPTVLSKSEEDRFAEWLIDRAKHGFGVAKDAFLDCVKTFMENDKRKTNFTEKRLQKIQKITSENYLKRFHGTNTQLLKRFKAVTALNAYFQPKVNKTYKIYTFRNASQNAGESLDSYCTRLRRLAQTCEFDNKDEEIKSHIVMSCLSSRLRRRALREDMNLKALLDYARGIKMSEKQAKGIEQQEKLAKVEEVQAVRDNNKDILAGSPRHKKVVFSGALHNSAYTCYREF